MWEIIIYNVIFWSGLVAVAKLLEYSMYLAIQTGFDVNEFKKDKK
jgi:hypothetical protein